MQFAVPSLLVALAMSPPPREYYQTNNFTVYADTADAAKQVGDAAETYRAELAKLWLGAALDDWPEPCRIDVADAERPGGATQISFARGKVLFQRVNVQGPLERVLKGPLPHELTHVLFAHHFGFQPPRWVDEGGAILSEGEKQRDAHRKMFGQILDKGRQFPLRDFFGLRDYPTDMACLYAQGHSISGFLVAAKGHKAFLSFVRDGVERNWDDAVKDRYGYQNVEQLEKAWLAWATIQPGKAEAIAAPR
jgi:hypothetical protein